LLMAGHCGKAVSPSVFPEHVEGLRSKVRSFVVTSLRQSGTELDVNIFRTANCRIWNELLENVATAPSLVIFRRRLKTYLFQKSYPDILI